MAELKLVIRCAGIVRDAEGRVLLVGSDYGDGLGWILPGGGLESGELLHACVEREVCEETGIIARPTELIYMNESFTDTLHLVHLTYLCENLGGSLTVGDDPDQEHSVIKDVRFMSLDELRALERFLPEHMRSELLYDLETGFTRGVVFLG